MLIRNPRISFVAILLIALVKITISAGDCNVRRSKRQLLFPNSTLLQLNIGVGTPSPVKQVNVNWAIQANFQLPWNRTQIPVDILHANAGYDGDARKKRDVEARTDVGDVRKKRDTDEAITDVGSNDERKSDEGGYNEARKRNIEGYVNDARLYHFYKYVEDVLNGFGENGTSCVLQTLCQLGAEPLHSDSDDDLLHEIASFVLNPLNDVTSTTAPESLPYVTAYRRGVSGRACGHQCTLPLIDLFSQLH